MQKKIFRNLALKGGGVRGIAYTGSMQVLEDTGIMEDIWNVAGTSAGAIVAGFIALGYTSKEIQESLFKKSFHEFSDRHKLGEFNRKYGWHSGKNFLNWIESFVAGKFGNPKATFRDLKDAARSDHKKFKRLTVFATDLNEQEIVAFSSNTDDENILNVPIAEAIRASMSIPMYFDVWQFPDKKPNNHLYVDGGTMYNYPLTYFDTDEEGEEEQYHPYLQKGSYKYDDKTIGLFLIDQSSKKTISHLQYGRMFSVKNFIEYGKDLTSALLDSQYLDLVKHPADMARTVFIDSFGISPTNFDITDKCKCALIQSGINATVEKLKEWKVVENKYTAPEPHFKNCIGNLNFDASVECN